MRFLYPLFLLLVSSFGLAVSTIMLEQAAQPAIGFGGRRIVVGFTYGLICLGGMFAAFFPGPCSRLIGVRTSGEQHSFLDTGGTKILGVLFLHGHHPPGGKDSKTHELWFGRKSFCASCFGLFTGAFISLIAIMLFLFSDWIDSYLTHLLYFLGLAGVILDFLPAVLGLGARTRFLFGMTFVTGTCLMLIAMDIATANLAADALVVLLALLWLVFRISLSHRNYRQPNMPTLATGGSIDPTDKD